MWWIIGYALLVGGALVAGWGVFSDTLGGVLLVVGVAMVFAGIGTVIWRSRTP